MDFHMNQTQTKWELKSICVLPVSSAWIVRTNTAHVFGCAQEQQSCFLTAWNHVIETFRAVGVKPKGVARHDNKAWILWFLCDSTLKFNWP